MSNKTLSYYAIGILLLVLCIGIVSAEPPKIMMKVNPTTGDAPLTITVSEDSGDTTITTWLWNFGNGDSLDKPSGEYTQGAVTFVTLFGLYEWWTGRSVT